MIGDKNMILDGLAVLRWNNNIKNYYISKGYKYTKSGTKTGNEFLVEIKDLTERSNAKINIQCDYCGGIFENIYMNYIRNKKRGYLDKDACEDCVQIKKEESLMLQFGVKANSQREDVRKKNNSQSKSHIQFCKEIYSLYGDDYKILEKYTGNKRKIFIRHKCGRIWRITPINLLNGHGCPDCFSTICWNTTTLKEEVYRIFKEEYTVLGEYVNAKTKVTFRHEKCGKTFETIPYSLLNRKNCPKCEKSKGEKNIELFLKNNNIIFEPQYKINNCKNILPLPFDFAVFKNEEKTEIIYLIEYDGEFHYMEPKFIKNEQKRINTLKLTQKRDKIKSDYCINNNINLIRIPYWDFNNIENILNNLFNLKGCDLNVGHLV